MSKNQISVISQVNPGNPSSEKPNTGPSSQLDNKDLILLANPPSRINYSNRPNPNLKQRAENIAQNLKLT